MSSDFDPYHKWLGIPPHDQPADHYRLLGIERFENDADVISLATDQRMSFLRTFQTGDRGKLSQKILGEVAEAKICLLNEDQKAQYDAQLRVQNQTNASDEELGLEVTAAWTPQELSAPSQPLSDNLLTNTPPEIPLPEQDRRKIKKRSIILGVLGISATVLLLLLAADVEEETADSKATEDSRDGILNPEFEISILESAEATHPVPIDLEREQASQRLTQEAEREAAEQAERRAKQEAEYQTSAEAAQKRRKDQYREQKERREREIRQQKEMQRLRKLAAQRKIRTAAERRAREEAARTPDPETDPRAYLESIGLVREDDSWEMESHRELIDVHKHLKSVERDYKDLLTQKAKVNQLLQPRRKSLAAIARQLRLPAELEALQDLDPDFFQSRGKKGMTAYRQIRKLVDRVEGLQRRENQIERELRDRRDELEHLAERVLRLADRVEEHHEFLLGREQAVEKALTSAGGRLRKPLETKLDSSRRDAMRMLNKLNNRN